MFANSNVFDVPREQPVSGRDVFGSGFRITGAEFFQGIFGLLLGATAFVNEPEFSRRTPSMACSGKPLI